MTGPRDVTLYFGRVRVMKMRGHGRTTLYKRPIPMDELPKGLMLVCEWYTRISDNEYVYNDPNTIDTAEYPVESLLGRADFEFVPSTNIYMLRDPTQLTRFEEMAKQLEPSTLNACKSNAEVAAASAARLLRERSDPSDEGYPEKTLGRRAVSSASSAQSK